MIEVSKLGLLFYVAVTSGYFIVVNMQINRLKATARGYRVLIGELATQLKAKG